jgi:hypothetical protein
VVHYDLPWTAMRIEQREGRSRRLGARHAESLVVRMEPAPWIEDRLRIRAILRRKEALLTRSGLRGDGAGWRWRHDRAAEWVDHPARCGSAALVGERARALVAFQSVESGSGHTTVSVVVVDDDGRWTEEGSSVTRALSLARSGGPCTLPDEEKEGWRRRIALVAAALAQRGTARTWTIASTSRTSLALLDRLRALVRTAAMERDRCAMEALEHRIAFTVRGHTAGEEAELERMLAAPDQELKCERPGPVVTGPGSGSWSVRPIAVIVEVPRRPP